MPIHISDQYGNLRWSARYEVWGEVKTLHRDNADNPLRFQGQYFDAETGLHYNRHRYFDPHSGQFISQDPIGLLGGSNPYQYAVNPLVWSDPLGLKCKQNAWNKFQRDTKGHFANSSAAAASYRAMKHIAEMGGRDVKLNRPLPSTYLPQSFLDNHIDKFNREGGACIAIQSWMNNPKIITLPPRKFVGLRSEMDAVIEKYELSEKDWRVLRDELSLGKNTDLSNDDIAYIPIHPNDSRFSYDIPTGREAGAYEGEWIPGGKTKGGTSEAALIGSENITHNNSLDELMSNFPDSKRIK